MVRGDVIVQQRVFMGVAGGLCGTHTHFAYFSCEDHELHKNIKVVGGAYGLLSSFLLSILDIERNST